MYELFRMQPKRCSGPDVQQRHDGETASGKHRFVRRHQKGVLQMKMSIVAGQRRLALLWGGGSFLALFVLVVETYGKVWGSLAPEAFGWFFLMVVPTLTLIVGSVVAEQTKATPSTSEVTPLAF